MKRIKFFTALMFFLSTGLIIAQTSQGRTLIGLSSTFNVIGSGSDLMNIGYTTIKVKSDANEFDDSDPDKLTSINASPRIGYFIADHFAIGLDLGLVYSSTKSGTSEYKYAQTLFIAGPFVRYYIPSSGVLPFLELNGAIGTLNSKFGSDMKDKANVMSFGGGVGLASPLGDRVVFDVLAGYNYLTMKDTEDNDDNYRTVMGALGLKVGFTIFLGS